MIFCLLRKSEKTTPHYQGTKLPESTRNRPVIKHYSDSLCHILIYWRLVSDHTHGHAHTKVTFVNVDY